MVEPIRRPRLLKSRLPLGPVLALAASLTACAPFARPIISHRGFVPDPEAVASVRVGIDNKNSVTSRLGTPSTTGEFDGETWYYVSQTQRQFLFHRPKTTQQNILAIRFDQNNLVSQMETFGLENERQIAFVKRTTPTRGKELSFIEQMFGNFGRFSSESERDQPRPD